HHRLRALQLSTAGLADRDCGHDDFIRHRPDAGPNRGRRDHGCGGQPLVRAQYFRSDAGAGRRAVRVSEEGGAEAVGWAKARLRAVPTKFLSAIDGGLAPLSPPYDACVRRDDERDQLLLSDKRMPQFVAHSEYTMC